MVHNLEIPSLSEAAEEKEDDCLKGFKHNHSDKEEIQDDNDETKSDDVFVEDISSSLININQDKANEPIESISKQGSFISNPFENTLICVSDMDFKSHFATNQGEEPNQHSHESWRHVINVTNHDSIQEDDGNQSRNLSTDFQLESNYQRQCVTTTRRVYRYRQNRSLSSSSPAQIAVSESSVLSSDFRMSMSMFENNSELEDDSVFEEEEEVVTNEETSENGRFL